MTVGELKRWLSEYDVSDDAELYFNPDELPFGPISLTSPSINWRKFGISTSKSVIRMVVEFN